MNRLILLLLHLPLFPLTSFGLEWIMPESGTMQAPVGIAYGNGQDGVFNSRDGLTWARENLHTSACLHSIVFADHGFTAAGDDGIIFQSSALCSNCVPSAPLDDWRTDLLGQANLRGITYANGRYGNGLFVAVGNDISGESQVLSSSDGVIWTVHHTGQGENLRSVAYGDGRFVAVGNAGTVLRSGSFAPARLAVRARPSDEGFELSITGEVGRTYRVQGNQNLDSTNWLDLLTFSNTGGTTTLFLDSEATRFPRRFYRVVSP